MKIWSSSTPSINVNYPWSKAQCCKTNFWKSSYYKSICLQFGNSFQVIFQMAFFQILWGNWLYFLKPPILPLINYWHFSLNLTLHSHLWKNITHSCVLSIVYYWLPLQLVGKVEPWGNPLSLKPMGGLWYFSADFSISIWV